MAIFRRDSPSPETSPTRRPRPPRDLSRAPAARSSTTYIAPGSRVTGEIGGTTEVLIDGELDGSVKLNETVTVGREGFVQGNIEARVVRVAGRVAGDVRAHDLVELDTTASFEGNLAAPRVIISEGAYFKGNVEMLGVQKSGGPGQSSGDSQSSGHSELGRPGTAKAPKTQAKAHGSDGTVEGQGALYSSQGQSSPGASANAGKPREGS